MKSSDRGENAAAHVVIGASSGVGAAVATALAAQGAHVYAASRRGHGGAATMPHLRCDVRSYAQVKALLAAVPEPVGHVINCVGVGFYAPMEGGDCSAAWTDMAQTNLVGLANLLSATSGLSRPLDNFVHVGSLAAYRPSKVPGNAFYSATKLAARALIEEHRRATRAAGGQTRVLSVSPGFIEGTDFGRNFYRHRPELDRDMYDEFTALSPDDVAELIVFALRAPGHVELNDMIVRPRGQLD